MKFHFVDKDRTKHLNKSTHQVLYSLQRLDILHCDQVFVWVNFLAVTFLFVCSHSTALGVDELSLNFVVQRNRAAFSETDAECNGFTELPCQSPMPSTSMGVVQLLLSIRRPCLLFFKGRGKNKHAPWTFFKHVDMLILQKLSLDSDAQCFTIAGPQ